MSERAQRLAVPSEPAAVIPVGGRALLRLKSWLPQPMTGGSAPLLGGRELPQQVGEVSSGAMRVLCVGPGEWLIASDEQGTPGLRERIEVEIAQQNLALADLTDGFAVLRIQASFARGLLSKGCGLDFHLLSFPPGRCARTRFAQIPVVVDCLEPTRWELYVGRSYLRHLHAWLTDSALEFEQALAPHP
jgi:sarcosine oxidase subunit gamma